MYVYIYIYMYIYIWFWGTIILGHLHMSILHGPDRLVGMIQARSKRWVPKIGHQGQRSCWGISSNQQLGGSFTILHCSLVQYLTTDDWMPSSWMFHRGKWLKEHQFPNYGQLVLDRTSSHGHVWMDWEFIHVVPSLQYEIECHKAYKAHSDEQIEYYTMF